MMETTFVIIKPDAIKRGLIGEILQRFEDVGFSIEIIELKIKSKKWCREHYAHIFEACKHGKINSFVYAHLEQFMTDTPLIGISLQGINVINRIRLMVGATNCLEADLGTIRSDFGISSGYQNLVHAADSTKAVLREMELFFEEE